MYEIGFCWKIWIITEEEVDRMNYEYVIVVWSHMSP